MIEEEEVDVPVKSKDPSSAMDVDKESGTDTMGASADAVDAKMEADSNSADASGSTENGEQRPSEMEVEPPKVCFD